MKYIRPEMEVVALEIKENTTVDFSLIPNPDTEDL